MVSIVVDISLNRSCFADFSQQTFHSTLARTTYDAKLGFLPAIGWAVYFWYSGLPASKIDPTQNELNKPQRKKEHVRGFLDFTDSYIFLGDSPL